MSDHGLQVQIFIPLFAFTEGSIKSPNITIKSSVYIYSKVIKTEKKTKTKKQGYLLKTFLNKNILI